MAQFYKLLSYLHLFSQPINYETLSISYSCSTSAAGWCITTKAEETLKGL